MAIENKQSDFEQAAKRQLDDSLETIDAATLSRLNQARQRALSYEKKKRPFHSSWATGLLGIFAVAMLVITIIPSTQQSQPLVPSLITEQWDVLVMADEDELELVNELDFYQWLDDVHG
jgi:hypothetical protein